MRFKHLLALAFFVSIGVTIFGAAAAAARPQDDMASKLPEGEGKGYVQTLCTSCHGLGQIISQRKSAEGWEATVSSMLERISAGMDQETAIISKYLAANFGVKPAGGSSDAKGAGAAGGSGKIGVSHQVLFNFKPEVPEEKRKAILASGKKVFESIPQVQSVVVGKVMQKDAELPYGLFVGVKNEEDLQTYRNHPDHKKWVDEVFRPAITKSVVTDVLGGE